MVDLHRGDDPRFCAVTRDACAQQSVPDVRVAELGQQPNVAPARYGRAI